MKKFISIFLVAVLVALCPIFLDVKVEAAENVYTVNDYAGLKNAFSKASSSGDKTTIYVSGEIAVEENISVKGNVTVIGGSNAVLLMNSATAKSGFELNKNCSLTVKNLTVKRTVADETERFVFYTYASNVTLSFEEVVFDVKTLEIASVNYDRITYCATADAMTIYANNCSFLTDGYFYRGLMVFYNCDALPQTGGSPTVKNFSDLKIDYDTGKLIFPADVMVSTDEDFSSIVKSGTAFGSETEYFVQKDGFVFSFTTKKLKRETPTQASVSIDYATETISFSSEYMVSRQSDFSTLLESGATVNPADVLYVKQKGVGIFQDSEVFVMTLPSREPAVETTCAFVCEFGFAINHINGLEYKVFDEYQDSPVFIDLQSSVEYTVTVRVKATKSAFCSEEFELKVTTL